VPARASRSRFPAAAPRGTLGRVDRVEILALCAAAVAVLMIGTWLVSLRLRDVSIIDPVWGLAFVVVACSAALAADGDTGRRLLLVALVGVWGLRLFVHLAVRKRGEPEDRRYAAMRARNPGTFPARSLVTVFGLQALLVLVVSLPVQMAAAEDGALGVLALVGAAVWAVGFAFESVGDLQLTRFRKDPANRGRVLDSGLWRYTRHPNYFGDFVVWWGLFLVALDAGGTWWTVIGPLVMSALLMRVSGVTLLEKDITSRRPGYADYVRRTSPFFPLPPRGA
jgi:steroid 5-alpha reductase family enzyme